MSELEPKGTDWFEIEFCGPCTCKNCEGDNEQTTVCIEAEKLRILKTIERVGLP